MFCYVALLASLKVCWYVAFAGPLKNHENYFALCLSCQPQCSVASSKSISQISKLSSPWQPLNLSTLCISVLNPGGCGSFFVSCFLLGSELCCELSEESVRLLSDALVPPGSLTCATLDATGDRLPFIRSFLSMCSLVSRFTLVEPTVVRLVVADSHFLNSWISPSRDACLSCNTLFSSHNLLMSPCNCSQVCMLASCCSCACAPASSYSWRCLMTEPLLWQHVHTYNSALVRHTLNAS